MIKNLYRDNHSYNAWRQDAIYSHNTWAERFLALLDDFEELSMKTEPTPVNEQLEEALAEIKVQREAIELQKTEIDILKAKLYQKTAPTVNTIAKMALNHKANVGSLNAIRKQYEALEKENQALKKIVDEVAYLINSGYDGPMIGEEIEDLFRAYANLNGANHD